MLASLLPALYFRSPMYKYVEAAKIAIASILSHKLRSFLTLLGVIIGVAVVTAVATVIEGANVYISEKIATLGSGVFRVQKASPTGFGNFEKFLEALRKNPDLTIEDLAALRESVTLAENVGAQDGTSQPVKYGNTPLEGIGVQGVTPNAFSCRISKWLKAGTSATSTTRTGATSASSAQKSRAGFLHEGDPLGKDIRIGRDHYQIIGVAKGLGAVLGISQDNFVQMPLSTFRKAFGSRRSLTFIVRARDGVSSENVQDQVRVILRTRHKLDYNQPDDFSLITDEVTEQLFGQITGTVAAVAFPSSAYRSS